MCGPRMRFGSGYRPGNLNEAVPTTFSVESFGQPKMGAEASRWEKPVKEDVTPQARPRARNHCEAVVRVDQQDCRFHRVEAHRQLAAEEPHVVDEERMFLDAMRAYRGKLTQERADVLPRRRAAAAGVRVEPKRCWCIDDPQHFTQARRRVTVPQTNRASLLEPLARGCVELRRKLDAQDVLEAGAERRLHAVAAIGAGLDEVLVEVAAEYPRVRGHGVHRRG